MRLSLEQVMKTCDVRGNVFDIKRFAMHDGSGIRTTIFLKGCPLRCVWCQNPEGIEETRQILYTRSLCIHCGSCSKEAQAGGIVEQGDEIIIQREAKEDWDKVLSACPTNALHFDSRSFSVEEIMEEIKKDLIFYRQNGGVTFSGGEPLYQFDFLLALVKRCKEEGLHVALETSLATSRKRLQQILPLVDLIYMDLKIIDTKQHQQYIGIGNRVILENINYVLTSDERHKAIVRTPLIPTKTDQSDNICGIAKFLSDMDSEVHYELLNYNPLAKAKYSALDEDYCFVDNPKPFTKEQMRQFYQLAKKCGIHNVVGNEG